VLGSVQCVLQALLAGLAGLALRCAAICTAALGVEVHARLCVGWDGGRVG
jgi:hypothetical protein